jgi:FixJ family two-component response regulator
MASATVPGLRPCATVNATIGPQREIRRPAQRLRNTIVALLCSDAERAILEPILDIFDCVLQPVRTLTEARHQLVKCHSPVVICDAHFPNEDWRELLASLLSLANRTNLVLLSGHDSALGAELLNLGGYDLLETPLDRSECFHVFASALRAE